MKASLSMAALRSMAVVITLYIAGLLSGVSVAVWAEEISVSPYASVEFLAQVLAVVERDYVEALPVEALSQAAIEGIVERLDEHSVWLNPEDAALFEQDAAGEFVGIGVEIAVVPEGARIETVLPGGPAARDGVSTGDLVVEVNGRSLAGMDADAVSTLLAGPRGEEVVLGLLRDGTRLRVDTVRDTVILSAVSSGWVADGVAYLHLSQFHRGAASQALDALSLLNQDTPVEGIVLDLRDNPGGLIEEAVALADLFVDEGLLLSTEGRVSSRQEFWAYPEGFDARVPIAVLVNRRSASAAEITAGTLHDRGRARLFGEATYGKGSVQSLYRNRDGSALKLTVARYFLPSGAPVERGTGLLPDQQVSRTRPVSPKEQFQAKLLTVEMTQTEREELTALLAAWVDEPPEPYGIPWEDGVSARAKDPEVLAALAWLRGDAAEVP